ncbi:NADH dehydrogenase [ubiquinone] 1 beta subcomplex subunit 3-like [Mya arenaria]|uniref:NADH dehydrogenase [ubiquinone] 1 beta subcomplex subunit 3-like n=1 Tax=Mya arenaria TaxID=6604 RepID=UPI0022E82615|nr:NADH dehydrogenase [ubiquinone] 1 beta subcomplex subunit 3-like [Mya arenaria]
MGGGTKMNIPDYKIYKVEDVPELKRFQERMAKEGLKDPWLRNHVWKYQNPLLKGMTAQERIFKMPGTIRGIWIGIAVTCAVIIGDKLTGGHLKHH